MGDGVETRSGEVEQKTKPEGGEIEERHGYEDLENPGEEPEQPEPVEEQPPEPEDDGMAAALAGLDARLEESQRLLARKSDLVDRLHSENQDLRAGELRSAQLPLVRDLLRMHDDLGRMREASAEADGDLRILEESLIDTLARNGIARFSPGPGEPFDPSLHSAVGVKSTDDEALDKTVAEVTRHGFRWDSGDTIRVAEVRAYRYRGAG